MESVRKCESFARTFLLRVVRIGETVPVPD